MHYKRTLVSYCSLIITSCSMHIHFIFSYTARSMDLFVQLEINRLSLSLHLFLYMHLPMCMHIYILVDYRGFWDLDFIWIKWLSAQQNKVLWQNPGEQSCVVLCVCTRAHALMYSVYNGEFVFLVSPLYLETDRPFLRLLFILMGNWLLIGCYHPRSSSRASSASKLTRTNMTPTHQGGPTEGLEGRGLRYTVKVTSQTDLFQT